MPEIVLIGRQWRFRALVKAQLEEEGHTVTGFVTLDDALGPLRTGLLAPGLIVLDTAGQDLYLDQAKLEALRDAAGEAKILVITGPFDVPGLDFRALGFNQVMRRPVFIKDIVARVEEIVAKA